MHPSIHFISIHPPNRTFFLPSFLCSFLPCSPSSRLRPAPFRSSIPFSFLFRYFFTFSNSFLPHLSLRPSFLLYSPLHPSIGSPSRHSSISLFLLPPSVLPSFVNSLPTFFR